MKNLFWYKDPYDLNHTENCFKEKMIENMLFQYDNCEEYRMLLKRKGFDRNRIQRIKGVEEIPFIPTLYFKHHRMISMPDKKIVLRATSSGTSGNKSIIGFDFKSLWDGLGMVLKIGKKHKLLSLRPCHYIVLGYEYVSPRSRKKQYKKTGREGENTEMAVAKTAYGFTFFTPALSRTFALKYNNGKYELNLEAVKKKLIQFSKQKTPVRLMGFPFHAYWLLSRMKEEGITCHLPKGSMMAFGGGWKQYYTQRADKETMYKLVEEVLGIKEDMCREFYGAVEHPILYTDCKNHHFHLPIYGRVVIRDVDTYEPVANETPGLVNLLTPMIRSVPLLSIMTDDLGILHDGERCGCGITTPYFEILGRVGMEDIVTCAAGAENLTKTILMEEEA